jgi:predicted outer membrane repeat protein
VRVANSQFHGNSATEHGGAVRALTDVRFEHCVFGGNEAGDRGGALDAYRDTGNVSTREILQLGFDFCNFAGNRAHTGFNGWGGGVYLKDANGVLTNCAIFGIKAYLLNADPSIHETDLRKSEGRENWLLANRWDSSWEELKEKAV